MISTLTDLNIYSSNLELRCVDLVENELDIFFNGCCKSAYTYSSLVSKDFKNHSKDNFEKTVLNNDELISLVTDIVYKLNYFFNDLTILHEDEIKYKFDEDLIFLDTLNNTVMQNKSTYNITIFCEKVIDEAIFKSFNLFHSGLISDYLLEKVNFGSLILGKNNSKSLTEKYQRELYHKIEGILMNIKMDIRHFILKNFMEQISNN
jgi:hypothetical protein